MHKICFFEFVWYSYLVQRMKKHTSSAIIACIALLFGFFIVSASLISASQEDLNADATTATTRKLYVGEILPDHVLYPVLMATDKALSQVVIGDEKTRLYLRFSQDRLEKAESLLQKNQEQLALATLTKSQKYLLLAAQHALFEAEKENKSIDAALKQELISSFLHSQAASQAMKEHFVHQDVSAIDQLVAESIALLRIIESK